MKRIMNNKKINLFLFIGLLLFFISCDKEKSGEKLFPEEPDEEFYDFISPEDYLVKIQKGIKRYILVNSKFFKYKTAENISSPPEDEISYITFDSNVRDEVIFYPKEYSSIIIGNNFKIFLYLGDLTSNGVRKGQYIAVRGANNYMQLDIEVRQELRETLKVNKVLSDYWIMQKKEIKHFYLYRTAVLDREDLVYIYVLFYNENEIKKQIERVEKYKNLAYKDGQFKEKIVDYNKLEFSQYK